MKYGIEVGQVYIAADGGHYGHLVVDTTTYAYRDDVVVLPFTEAGFKDNVVRIDMFKLAQVRYYIPDTLPAWVPEVSANQTTSSAPCPT